MRRREFLGLAAGAATWPLPANGQQSRGAALGFLGSASADGYTATVTAVRKGLNETGYFEDRNLTIEYRWADFRYEKLPARR